MKLNYLNDKMDYLLIQMLQTKVAYDKNDVDLGQKKIKLNDSFTIDLVCHLV